MPEWFSASWLLTIGWSPLYQELTRAPLVVRAPGLPPGRRSALTTAPDIPATILELAGAEPPPRLHGRSFREALAGGRDEHRPFVVSSWPLYFARGEMTSAVDGRVREIASYMPITVTTRELSLVIGGPGEPPELYDLAHDPAESVNVWDERTVEGSQLFADALAFLEECGTAERFLAPRRESALAFGALPA